MNSQLTEVSRVGAFLDRYRAFADERRKVTVDDFQERFEHLQSDYERKKVEAEERARHFATDFNIFRLIAHHWGCADLFREWSSPEAVFQILKRLSAGRPCDFTGIADYADLDARGGVQWPWPADAGDYEPERRLFEDGVFYHADGRARFRFDEPSPMPEPPDDEYPVILLTGRGTSSQWHTQTRTGK